MQPACCSIGGFVGSGGSGGFVAVSIGGFVGSGGSGGFVAVSIGGFVGSGGSGGFGRRVVFREDDGVIGIRGIIGISGVGGGGDVGDESLVDNHPPCSNLTGLHLVLTCSASYLLGLAIGLSDD